MFKSGKKPKLLRDLSPQDLTALAKKIHGRRRRAKRNSTLQAPLDFKFDPDIGLFDTALHLVNRLKELGFHPDNILTRVVSIDDFDKSLTTTESKLEHEVQSLNTMDIKPEETLWAARLGKNGSGRFIDWLSSEEIKKGTRGVYIIDRSKTVSLDTARGLWTFICPPQDAVIAVLKPNGQHPLQEPIKLKQRRFFTSTRWLSQNPIIQPREPKCEVLGHHRRKAKKNKL